MVLLDATDIGLGNYGHCAAKLLRETYLIGWPKRGGERREAKATTTEWGDTFGHFRFGQLYFR